VAALIGLAAVAYLLPWSTITGQGLFANPAGDLVTNLIGHLAFQDDGWHWPILRAPSLAWPHGESVALTDSNPLLSLTAKLLRSLLGHRVNLFGIWLALCLALQPISAVYLLRAVRAGAPATPVWSERITSGAMACLALLLPAYMFRVFHINLLAHFILIFALGWAVLSCKAEKSPGFIPMAVSLALVVLIHPYLYLFTAAIFAAPSLHLLWRGIPGARAGLRALALAVIGSTALFIIASGLTGGGGPGYGVYSTNVLSPLWPQLSGLFGPDAPVLDATGYQHEGFNYLGAGILLIVATAIVACILSRHATLRLLRNSAGVWLVTAGLLALAITPTITIGHHVIGPATPQLVQRLFAVVRSSGRAVWVVDYVLLAFAISIISARLAPLPACLLLATAIGLQFLDTAPLRQTARIYFSGATQTPPAAIIPTDTTLFRAVPLCSPQDVDIDPYRLLALRAGAHLAEARLAYPPTDAACAAALRAGLSEPLEPGETRLFLPGVLAALDQSALGPNVTCRRAVAGTVCHRATR
jgi:hypothetical protein